MALITMPPTMGELVMMEVMFVTVLYSTVLYCTAMRTSRCLLGHDIEPFSLIGLHTVLSWHRQFIYFDQIHKLHFDVMFFQPKPKLFNIFVSIILGGGDDEGVF